MSHAQHLTLQGHLTRRINWFPGHMASALRAMRTSKRCTPDAVLDVRDARAPLSSAPAIALTRSTTSDINRQPIRIVVLNKADLAHPLGTRAAAEAILRDDPKCQVFTLGRYSSKSPQNDFDHDISIIQQLKAYGARRLLVCGAPNVGKSTLINRLRSLSGLKKAAPTGAQPGVTKSLSTKMRLGSATGCEGDRLYVLDSPGISDMRPASIEYALNLALVGSYPDARLDIDQTAEFLYLQARRAHATMPLYGPQLSLLPQYALCSKDHDKVFQDVQNVSTSEAYGHFLECWGKRIGVVDSAKCAARLIDMFRKGRMGRVNLDVISQPFVSLESLA